MFQKMCGYLNNRYELSRVSTQWRWLHWIHNSAWNKWKEVLLSSISHTSLLMPLMRWQTLKKKCFTFDFTNFSSVQSQLLWTYSNIHLVVLVATLNMCYLGVKTLKLKNRSFMALPKNHFSIKFFFSKSAFIYEPIHID